MGASRWRVEELLAKYGHHLFARFRWSCGVVEAGARFCGECGHSMPAGTAFCGKCGAPREPVSPNAPPPGANRHPTRVLLATLVVAVVLIAGVGVLLALRNEPASTTAAPGPTQTASEASTRMWDC